MSPKEKSSSGCRTAFLIGCGLFLLLALVLVALVAFNWDRMTGAFETAKESIEEVVALQAELNEAFPAERIGINQHFGSGGRILRIELVDPRFLDAGDSGDDVDVDLEAKAREVAAFAIERIGDPDALDAVAVQITRRASEGSRGTTRVAYEFSAEELRGTPPPAE